MPLGSAEIDCVFFFFGSLFLFVSQLKRKSEHKKHNLCMWSIEADNTGYVNVEFAT